VHFDQKVAALPSFRFRSKGRCAPASFRPAFDRNTSLRSQILSFFDNVSNFAAVPTLENDQMEIFPESKETIALQQQQQELE
jgi:hypothetical protein